MKQIVFLLLILVVVTMFSCSKKDGTSQPEEPATKFPAPTWKDDTTGRYPATMTAVVALPAALAGDVLEQDQLAAFVGTECRGVGVLETVNNQKLYFVLIKGLSDESSDIKFRYYSSKTSYMYETHTAINFLIDAIYGTAQNPKTLAFLQLK